MAQARLLGFDADAYRRERNPRRQAIFAAEIDAAERKRADEREEQALRIIGALARAMPR